LVGFGHHRIESKGQRPEILGRRHRRDSKKREKNRKRVKIRKVTEVTPPWRATRNKEER